MYSQFIQYSKHHLLQRKFGILIIILGVAAIALAILITPTFAANYLSPNHNLALSTIKKLSIYRHVLLIVGILLIISGSISITVKETKLRQIMAFSHTEIFFHSIAIVGLFCAWAVLYSLYLINHNIPTNPGGFYLESARQLAQNRFLIPEYVQGFGKNGIPFVYPPLTFYVLAAMGYILGGILKVALYLPGFLLLIQAILMYFFMKQWTGSKQASLWAAMVLLLVPQIFYRTIFADGITTGFSSIFVLASWILAIRPVDKSNTYRKSIVGGIFVGLSILSHPALGLFCSVSFAIWYIYRNGWNITAIKGLFSSGITAFLVILPWLLAVISMHGTAPLLAGLHASPVNSGSDIIGTIKSTLANMYYKNITRSRSDSVIFWVFPFILAMIYDIIRGPRILA
jgi:4-amino-4-deoxy-L-arabinose transferase and related glycosyltransferases of PMT family